MIGLSTGFAHYVRVGALASAASAVMPGPLPSMPSSVTIQTLSPGVAGRPMAFVGHATGVAWCDEFLSEGASLPTAVVFVL